MTPRTLANVGLGSSTVAQTNRLYSEQLHAVYCRADYLFVILLLLEWMVAVAFALLVSPYTWAGESFAVHIHVWAAILLGGAIVSLPVTFALTQPGATTTRHTVAIGQMLMGALLIHLGGGRIEVHFHIFGSLAFLALYRDWKVLITASAIVAADHFLRGIFWPRSIYGVVTVSPWRWVEHSAWVVFEDMVLIRGCLQSLREMHELAFRQAELAAAFGKVEQLVEERTADLYRANEDLTRQAAQVRESQAVIMSIVETAPDAIVMIDHLGHVIEFNPAAEGIFGYSKGHALGRRVDDLIIPPELRKAHNDGLARYLATGEGRTIGRRLEVTSIKACGTEFPAELAINTVTRPGLPPLFVAFVRDITARKIAEESLRQAAVTAQAASRAKSEFLANMSHEIRTPMNGVIGMTELTLDTELTPRQREYLGMVKSSADSLMIVINDILDFSKIEAGKLSLDTAPFALRAALDETLHTLALRAHSKGIELACRIDPDVPDALIGDSGRLRQVLVNLIGNAIKFTARGEVIVSVQVEDADDGVALRVAVADTGIGIPVVKLDTIFRPFEQADGSTTRHFGGTGLGLSISVRLIELMGGCIWVESEPGVGSTFWFTAKLGAQPKDVSCRSEPDLLQLEGLVVLVVDDNATNRLILTEVLTGWGTRPIAVDSGPAALDALRSAKARGETIPIALIDGMMPGMDGFDLIERIRSDPEIAQIRLLLLTSAGPPEDTARCRALKISDCLTKPVRQSLLYNSVVNAIALRNRDAEDSSPSLKAGERPGRALAQRELQVLLAEDHPVNQKVAVRMLQRSGHTVVVASDGRQALEAIGCGHFDVVLMDLQMPEMDGFEALRTIREREATTGEHLPVIALTAHAMNGDRERCLRAGFDGYLAKPIRQVELEKALSVLETDNHNVSNPDHSLLTELSKICGGDIEFIQELAVSFLDSAPRCVAEIDIALRNGDLGALAAGAHALNGISRTIGAEDMAEVCKRLEIAAGNAELKAAATHTTRLVVAWHKVWTTLENLVVLEVK
jgi:two-component system, sensor histidine kinase and response regulator